MDAPVQNLTTAIAALCGRKKKNGSVTSRIAAMMT